MRSSFVTAERVATAQRWVAADLPEADREMLFQPIRVGPVMLRNRFAMSAMGTRFASARGEVTERQIGYYTRRARGGAAAIFVEGTSVDPQGSTYPNKPRLYDPSVLTGLAHLADAIRSGGAIPGIQVMHSGRHSSPDSRTGPPVSASGGRSPVHHDAARALTTADVRDLIERFGAAARAARQIGFDIIEIHAAHAYLLHDFLSPVWNKRNDEYGGDRDGRVRLLLEVIRATRDGVGSGGAIMVRLSSSDPIGGITTAESERTAVSIADAGADAVLISNGSIDAIEWIVPPVLMPFGSNLNASQRVKRLVRVPVAVVGRISTPQVAANAIRSGAADLLFIGRAALADPDFVEKIRHPGPVPIRPCIACNECLAQHIRREPILCTVNPAAGREADEASTSHARRPRRIAVVGSGPAGLQFTVRAAERGHMVTLIEKRAQVGGKLWLAAEAPYKTLEMLALRESLDAEVKAREVRLQLSSADLGRAIRDSDPELVVIASGARPSEPTDVSFVDGAEMHQAEDFLSSPRWQEWDRVAIIGAGDTACDAAARLASTGSRVWLLARGDRIARGVEPVSSRVLRRYLRSLGVEAVLNLTAATVRPGSVAYTEQDGTQRELEVDHVLYSRGVRASGDEVSALIPSDLETLIIGDAESPGNFLTGMRSAWLVANEV